MAFSFFSVEETSSGGPEPYLRDQKREIQPQEQGLRRYRRMTNDGVDVRSRQDPLRKHYRESPEDARITDRAKTSGGTEMDPFHGKVVPGSEDHGVKWSFGIHRAVGGDHDLPNPGDLLAAALAACLDATIRIIAARMGVSLMSLSVEVVADVDVRGCLQVDRGVPVGFQEMRCHVALKAANGTDPQFVQMLVAASENSCVNFQTLRSGVRITTSTDVSFGAA
jgi:uncharacterized OsmC-like protein